MKDSLSALELKFIVDELKMLVGSRLDRVYQPKREEFILQFYSKEGKRLVRIVIGKAIYLASAKDVPETPSGFCQSLRKHLEGMKLEAIIQPGFERIVKFIFTSKEKSLSLVFELFGKGNVALVEEPGEKILVILEQLDIKDRRLHAGLAFAYPERKHDPFNLAKDELKEIINTSDKDSIVKILASDLGIGGIYSEEICIRSGIDKNKKKLNDDEMIEIIKTINEIKNEKLKPNVVFKDDKIVEILPFELTLYKNYKKEYHKTFNGAIDSVLSKQIVVEKQKQRESKYSSEIKKLSNIIYIQSKQLQSLQKEAEQSQKMGEKIYEDYQKVKDVLDQLKEAKKKMSWEEIKAKSKKIKKTNPKENSAVVEI